MGDIIEAEFQLQIDDGSLREVYIIVIDFRMIHCMKLKSPQLLMLTFRVTSSHGSSKCAIYSSWFLFSKICEGRRKTHNFQVGSKVCEFFTICRTQNQDKVIERLQVKKIELHKIKDE